MTRILAALTDGESHHVVLHEAIDDLVHSIEQSDAWKQALSTPHGEMVGVFLDVDIKLKVLTQAIPFNVEVVTE